MKRVIALLLALSMIFVLTACGGDNGASQAAVPSQPQTAEKPADSQEPTDAGSGAAKEITLWTYPVGNWGKEDVVKALTDGFTAETGIAVKVEYLAYADGDDKINSAITAGQAPDLVLEGPERLVANWISERS